VYIWIDIGAILNGVTNLVPKQVNSVG